MKLSCKPRRRKSRGQQSSVGSSPVGRPANAMICVGWGLRHPDSIWTTVPTRRVRELKRREKANAHSPCWYPAALLFSAHITTYCLPACSQSRLPGAAVSKHFETTRGDHTFSGRRVDRVRLSSRCVSTITRGASVRQTRICIAVDLPALRAGPPSTGNHARIPILP
jgi:hypothetical protein